MVGATLFHQLDILSTDKKKPKLTRPNIKGEFCFFKVLFLRKEYLQQFLVNVCGVYNF